VVTALKNLDPRYVDIVRGVNFGGTSEHRNATPKVPGPHNRRAEMYARTLQWLELAEGVSLPDDGALQADLCAPKQKPRIDGFFQLESKQEMRRRRIRSPDLADAIVLTFAFNEFLTGWESPSKPSNFGNVDEPQQQRVSVAARSGGSYGWMG
jgi:hypothetical protein